MSDNRQYGYDTSQSDSICSSVTDNNQSGDETSESDVSDVSWDEEAYSALIQAVLLPAPALPGAPPDLTVDTSGQARAPSYLPLAIVTNAWSLKMKMNNMRTLLSQISPDFMNICETFEAAEFSLENSLEMEHYKVIL